MYDCGKLIDGMYRKWDENPVIVTFDKVTPVWAIPFPAVTICSETKVVWSKVRQSGLVNADYDYDYVCGLWCFKVCVTKPWSTREVLFSEARDRRSNRQKSHAVECDGAVESFLGRLSNSCQQTKQ
ncbi:hypothetical protein quinque_006296 [Culex quinquefasciatus]